MSIITRKFILLKSTRAYRLSIPSPKKSPALILCVARFTLPMVASCQTLKSIFSRSNKSIFTALQCNVELPPKTQRKTSSPILVRLSPIVVRRVLAFVWMRGRPMLAQKYHRFMILCWLKYQHQGAHLMVQFHALIELCASSESVVLKPISTFC